MAVAALSLGSDAGLQVSLESGSEPVEGSRVRELVKGLLDRQGAVAGTGGGGVALDVVAAVGVDLPELGGCLPGLPVAARFLPPCQFLFRAADTHEDDVESVEHARQSSRRHRSLRT